MNTLRVSQLCLICLMAAALQGSSNVQPSGFLQDYHRLYHVGGVPLEQVWIEPGFNIQDYRTLYIPPVQIDPLAYRRHGEEDHQKAQRIGVELRKRVERELKDAGIFAVVSTDPYFSTVRQQALTLQLRISEINSGNPRQRVLIGFGAGSTEIQIEGKLFEHKYCRTLAEFADRRLHGGAALLWGSKAASDSEFLMGIDAKQILSAIVKLFIFMREEGPPHEQR